MCGVRTIAIRDALCGEQATRLPSPAQRNTDGVVQTTHDASKCTTGGVPAGDSCRPHFRHHECDPVRGKLHQAACKRTRHGPNLQTCMPGHGARVVARKHTAKLEGSPKREPAQQGFPSSRASPPMIVARLPFRSYTSMRATAVVACETASRVLEAATPYGLSTPATHTWVRDVRRTKLGHHQRMRCMRCTRSGGGRWYRRSLP